MSYPAPGDRENREPAEDLDRVIAFVEHVDAVAQGLGRLPALEDDLPRMMRVSFMRTQVGGSYRLVQAASALGKPAGQVGW